MLETTGYLAMWEQAGFEEAERVENLNELASNIINFEQNSTEEHPSLAGFLEEMALLTDIDNYDANADSVILMTMHASKGLEFPVVILPGFEEGVFPGMQVMYNPDELEEDRRLCYVAITRAREELWITNATSRMLYGQTTYNRPSRFLNDVPAELMEQKDISQRAMDGNRFGAARGGGFGGGFGGGRYTPAPKTAVTSTAKPVGNTVVKSRTFSATPQAACTLQKGDKVSHGTFGNGTVVNVTPMGNDSLLEIAFDSAGTRKIMHNFAKLTKL
jgi:DNA helicase-2/ATP-dependent DNA helicase PcrA